MKRQIALQEISDGKLYESHEMVRAGCGGCEGCSDCCQGMGDSILLDPKDVYRLTKGLGKTMEELLQREAELGNADGIVLPHLRMTPDGCCPFLNEAGRCAVHPWRPGFCRMFPLGRCYEPDGFRYFLQVNECRRQPKTKVKIRKWIDEPQPERHERYVLRWHAFQRRLQDYAAETRDGALLRTLSLYVLRRFFLSPYDPAADFYDQFDARLREAHEALGLEEAADGAESLSPGGTR